MYFFSRLYSNVKNNVSKPIQLEPTINDEWETVDHDTIIQTYELEPQIESTSIVPSIESSTIESPTIESPTIESPTIELPTIKSPTVDPNPEPTIIPSLSLPRTPTHTYTSLFKRYVSSPVTTSPSIFFATTSLDHYTEKTDEHVEQEEHHLSILVDIIDFLFGKDVIDRMKESL